MNTSAGTRGTWRIFLIVAGPVIGLIAGFLLGKGGSGKISGERSPETSESSGVSIRTNEPKAIPEMDGVIASIRDGSSRIHRLRVMVDFVDRLETSEIHEALDRILSPGAGKRPRELIDALYERWVEADPEAAIAHAETRRGDDRSLAMNSAINAWSSKDPYEALAWLRGRPDLARIYRVAHGVVNGLAKSDPQAALEILRTDELFEGTNIRASPGFIYAAWAEKDPAEAVGRLGEIESPEDRKNAMMWIAESWISRDPDAALAWAMGLEEGPEKSAVFDGMLPILTAQDLDWATAFFDRLPEGELRSKMLYRLARSLANEDPDEAYEIIKSRTRNSSEVASAFYPILGQWTFQNPERAFEVALKELETGKSRSNILQYIIQSLAPRDLDLAIEMMSRMDEGAVADTANQVAEAFAGEDVGKALNWVSSLPRGKVRNEARLRVIHEWAAREPEAAAAHAMELSGKTGDQALVGALIQWGSADAPGAAAWAVENTEPEQQMAALPRILFLWGRRGRDQVAAKEWLLSFPEGEVRRTTIADSDFVSHWSKRDPNGMGEWINRIEPGPSRDAAVEKYAPTILATDPEAAIAWVESIDDEEVHLRTLESIARSYLERFPDGDRRWITDSALTEEKKTELLASP